MSRHDREFARLSFHGAARGVTGSCFLLEFRGRKILIDCGMYQGSRELEEENAEPFGFKPSQIDTLLLTHGHLDHCGRIPLLVKRGFRGEIVTTAATRELARLVMLDAAGIQEEDARRSERQARRHGGRPIKPLYTVEDALWAMDFFGRAVNYGGTVELGPGIRATFIDAGHILGSAHVVLELEDRGQRRTLVFSGDIGNRGRPIVNPWTPPPKADFVVMESTYGDRRHRSLPESVEELYQAIEDTLRRGGNVVIPSFALERAQEILYFLREGVLAGRLPGWMPVFLDSPMAITATEIFRRHPESVNETTRRLLEKGIDPFRPPNLHLTRETAQSMAINQIEGGAVIIAGSGMCTGGRVRHHLKHNLWREESSVVFVGFAAEGTLARQIIDGAREVDIFGERIQVRAKIWTINGFSAHADQAELLEWVGHTGHPRLVCLVHGEFGGGMAALADILRGRGHHVLEPALHQVVRLH